MILTDWEIQRLIDTKELVIDPYNPSNLNPASLDICLGNSVGIVKPTGKCLVGNVPVIDPSDKESFKCEFIEFDFFILQAGQFVLAPMLETMKLPSNIQAKLNGKSSMGRLGILNSSHAGLHDNAFAGVSTMEINNLNQYPILLKPKMKIGQLVFHRTEEPDKDYNETGRYQNQKRDTGSLGI